MVEQGDTGRRDNERIAISKGDLPLAEVLGRGQHPVLLVAPDVGPGQPPQPVDVGAEGADAQDRIIRAGLDVDDGRVGQMDADRPAFERAGLALGVGRLLGIDGREGHVSGEFRRALELLSRAALEVGGNEQGQVGLLLQPVEQAGRVVRGPAVDDEAPDAVFADEREKPQELGVVGGLIFAPHLLADHLADLPLEAQAGQRVGRPAFRLGVGGCEGGARGRGFFRGARDEQDSGPQEAAG